MKLFVYGTLRKGFNNNIYLSSSEFLGNATTKEGYTLACDGIPYMLQVQIDDSYVYGEVYEVSANSLEAIDLLEGNGYAYTRTPITVTMNGEDVQVETYLWLHKNKDGLPKYSDYSQYRTERAYGF